MFLAQLPVLVLPGAACCEALRLWSSMLTDGTQERSDAAAADVAAAAYWQQWMPFLLDFSAALQPHEECLSWLEMEAFMRGFLTQMEMPACLQLLVPEYSVASVSNMCANAASSVGINGEHLYARDRSRALWFHVHCVGRHATC